MRGVLPLLVGLSLLPTARAEPLCSAVTEQPPNALGVYLVLDPLRGGTDVYSESNGYPGLQRQPCVRDGTMTLAGADSHLVDAARTA